MAKAGKQKKISRSESKTPSLAEYEKPGPPDPRNPGQNLPSLLQAVEELLPWERRSTIVNRLVPMYGTSPRSIDRAIQQAKVDFIKRESRNRGEKIDDGIRQLENIARAAARAGKYQAARAAIIDRHKLAGNYAERIDLTSSLGSATEALENAKQLEVAAAEAQARAKARA